MVKKSGLPAMPKSWYKKKNIFKKIKLFFQGIKFKRQRIKYGWCEADTWNMDCWFISVVPPMLQYLRDNTHGYPGTMTAEEWNGILNRMIVLFNELDEEKCTQKNEYDDCISENKGAWLNRYKEIGEYQEKCKNEAFELFSKYFFNLWD